MNFSAILDSLPTLTKGTEKQIAWAEKIRKEQMELLVKGCEQTLVDAEGDAELAAKMMEKLQLAARKNAVWWIEHRCMMMERAWDSSTKTWTTQPCSGVYLGSRTCYVLDSIW